MPRDLRLAFFVVPFLLVFALPVLALYPDPPFAEVSAHNLALAPAFDDSYDPSIAVNGTMGMDFYGTDIYWVPIHKHVDLQLINASARILTMEPSVGESISASASPVLLFAWGSNATPLPTRDWEGDDCAEYQNGSSVSRSALVTFSFGNASESVSAVNNTVLIPDSILAAMANTTGTDVFQVRLNATFNFTYTIDDRRPSHDEGCAQHLANYSSSISAMDERNWTVEGNRTLFFLVAPVLGEQWFRNNHFDTVLFSNSRIYAGNISADSNQAKNFRLYEFNITNDSQGVWHIEAVPAQGLSEGIAGYSAYNTPVPLAPDNFTYGYVYELNYSYEGLGGHALEDDVSGLFSRSVFSREILSRMLSYSGNVSETGGPADPSVTRKSAAFSPDSMNTVTLSLGLAGLLLIVLLMRRLVTIK